MESLNNGRPDKNIKISKGYRLKISTHDKIKELQQIVKANQDVIISRAIKIYSREINRRLRK